MLSTRVFLATLSVVFVGVDVPYAVVPPPALAPADWTPEVGSPSQIILIRSSPPQIELTAKVAAVEVASRKRVNASTCNGALPGPLIRGVLAIASSSTSTTNYRNRPPSIGTMCRSPSRWTAYP
jgi:hypothetical protein